MNLDQIRNPHPTGCSCSTSRGARGSAWHKAIRMHRQAAALRVRSEALSDRGLPAVHLISPFLNDAVVFNANELERALRVWPRPNPMGPW